MPAKSACILLLLCVAAGGCRPSDPLHRERRGTTSRGGPGRAALGPMRTHYLIDYEYTLDREALTGTVGHLVVLNPGPVFAELTVTAFFEDREPSVFELTAAPYASSESSVERWPVNPGDRFALLVESSEPVVCQATVGWTNTANDYTPGAPTHSPQGAREAATSYTSSSELAEHWYLADGIVIDQPDRLWIRESEWALVLNPSDARARVTLTLFDGGILRDHAVEVAPRRLLRVLMDDIAGRNRHYGVRFSSDQPVAAQWRRAVYWYDSPEVMAFWSVPCVPLPAPVSPR